MNSDSKYTVLIVDDVPENIQALSGILYQQDVSIIMAQSGGEALSVVAQAPPDLILLNVIMPEIDGFEVCKQLKKNPETRDIPVIFLTALTQPEDIIKGFEAGAVDYVTKPFNTAELLSRGLTHLELKKSRDVITRQTQQLAEQNTELERQNSELQALYALKAQYFSDTLRESEERFRSTFEQAAVGIVHATPDGQFLLVNRRFCEIVGYTEQELLARRFQDITHPDDLEEDFKYLQQLLEGKSQTFSMEKRYIRQDDSSVWINLTGSLVRGPSGELKYLIGVIQDITQRKRSEQALQASERQYRLLVENMADGVGIFQEEKIVFANHALTFMLGCTSDQLFNMNPIALVRDDFKQEYIKRLESIEQGTAEQLWQVLCMTAGDREIWIETRHNEIHWEGKPALLFTARDITENKLREFAIEKEKEHLRSLNLALKATMKERYKLGDIIGKSLAMQEVYEQILSAAAADASVVISGESGTGKELVAWTIHKMSQRQDKAFMPVNCGAIPDTLFESEFFGHRKGAFTGAHKDQPGFFDRTHGGTLFLDEVAELSPAMQVKFLRVLSGGGYTPLGDHTVKKTNVRIIAATNKDLTKLIQQGKMREDFYYRIEVIRICLPPLRDRREDIPLLIDHFLKQFGGDSPKPGVPKYILHDLYEYDWPGNVRELQNALQRYLTTKRLDFIAPRRLETDEKNQVFPNMESNPDMLNFHEAVDAFEKQIVLRALGQNQWHRAHTAAMLGLSRRGLFRQMKKHGLI